MSDKQIKDAFDSININKEKIKNTVISEISNRSDKTRSSKIKNIASRKFVAIAAAMVVVLAFGAVAYGTGLFDLGKLKDPYTSGLEYEYPALEGSNQYKAAKEYNEYLHSLSNKELDQLYADMDYTYDEKTHISTIHGPNKVLKSILDKYGLKYDTKTFHQIKPVVSAIKKVGLSGFTDGFTELYCNKNAGSMYTEEGSLHMSNHLVPDYWELSIFPNNVFLEVEAFNYPNPEREKGSEKEWFYSTSDGNEVKCISYKIQGAYEDGNGNETPAMMRAYSSIIITDHYTFMFNYDKVIEDGADMSKKEFEQMLELFDYSKID